MSKHGHIPRPCWNRCGTEIVHRMDGGVLAWVETASGARHKCAKQPGKKADPRPFEANPWTTKTGRKGLRMGLSIADLKRGLRITGEHYKPFTHVAGCTAAPWDGCACP